ncbi:hypothetical protein TrRE_jg9070, partial [Triparma retinervis]
RIDPTHNVHFYLNTETQEASWEAPAMFKPLDAPRGHAEEGQLTLHLIQLVKGKVFAGTRIKAGGIFEKLTDKTLYTGVYKNLDGFSDGRINGYDGDVSGNIRDLSSMMRPSMRVNTKFIDV